MTLKGLVVVMGTVQILVTQVVAIDIQSWLLLLIADVVVNWVF